MTRPPVAFVVQRYGADVTGGSESLARALAERLAPSYDVTVFTTCARDYVTWRNERPAGEEVERGVRVRRFPVARERDLAAFNAFAEPLYRRPTTADEEQAFLERQGPVVPSLVEALGREQDLFAAVVFFTYLYYPTYWGLKAAPRRSVLVPTTHDEPPLRFSIYREVFALPRAFAFLTPAEQELVRARFGVGGRPAVVAGMGVDPPPPSSSAVAAFRARHGLARPYALYAGRIDAGKGCADMVSHHARYRREKPDALDLVLIGKLAMDEPRTDGVRHLGFLSEEEKAAALAGATVVVCPSPFESLSIVLLEGLALGAPALVNAVSPVLKEHCLRSNAGLFYSDGDEYVEAMDLLARDGALRAALAANGRRYVDAEYRWSTVLDRWTGLLAAVRGEGA
jgi:glycosyltransferase involved in cell wall biosynthesis